MAPFAEAGPRSFLFAGDIHVSKNGGEVVVAVEKPAILEDLKKLSERPESMTIVSDGAGKIFINEEETQDPVAVPKSATFEITENT